MNAQFKKFIGLLFWLVVVSYPFDDAEAETLYYGDWTIKNNTAYTINSAGSEFGIFCAKACVFVVVTKSLRCAESVTVPALLNVDGLVHAVQMNCVKVPGAGDFFGFDTDPDILQSVVIYNRLSIAIPTKSGDFLSLKFSLNGSRKAISTLLGGVKANESSDEYFM